MDTTPAITMIHESVNSVAFTGTSMNTELRISQTGPENHQPIEAYCRLFWLLQLLGPFQPTESLLCRSAPAAAAAAAAPA